MDLRAADSPSIRRSLNDERVHLGSLARSETSIRWPAGLHDAGDIVLNLDPRRVAGFAQY